MIVWKEGAPLPQGADSAVFEQRALQRGVQVYGSYRFAVASRRGGTLYCTQAGDRIRMSGNAAVYSMADIRID